jgi:hypothetical protein
MRDSSSGDKLKMALFGDLSLEEAMDLSRLYTDLKTSIKIAGNAVEIRSQHLPNTRLELYCHVNQPEDLKRARTVYGDQSSNVDKCRNNILNLGDKGKES